MGTWEAIKGTEDGIKKYCAGVDCTPPYNGHLARMLSRQFGEAKKAKIKEEARLVAEAAAAAVAPAAGGNAENVPNNGQHDHEPQAAAGVA